MGSGFAAGLFQWRRNFRWFVFLLVLVAAPITGVLLVSLVQPVFLARTLIWTTIPFSIAVAAGALSPKHGPLRMLILFAVVGLNLWGLADYYTSYRKESWDKAAAYVAGNAANGDVILIHKNYVKLPFNYYFRKYEKNVPQFPLPNDAAEREARIRALPPHQRIWLVGINVFLFDATSGAQKTSTQKP